MWRHVGSSHFNESPVKGVSRVIRLHRVIAVAGARVNATNMDAGRNLPAAAAFLGHHHHVFFQFSGAYRCTCDHFFLKHFRAGARGITKNLIVFSAAKRTVSMIDLALQKHDTPVGPLFVAVRHGRTKKCFTRDTAIRYLAFFMTTEAFERSGFPQRHPRERIDRADMEVWRDGETKAEYLAAHQRCVRRLRRILARKREMEKWCEKWDAMHERYVKERDELKATKPAGVR